MCAQLMAGAAKIVITPPVGVDLSGFGGREGPSIGIHDDLRAAALYLKSGQEGVLLITCDLIGLHRDEVADVRRGIEETTGLPGGRVMIGCSHTHSGPATGCLPFLGNVDAEYLAVLRRKLVGLGKMAHDNMQPCALGHLREPVSVGINRREMRGGQIVLGRNERGTVAPYVDVVAVDTMEGAPLARLFVHAAHAVTLGGDNLLISADWPGYAQRFVERIYGDGCVAMFGQGCCGNINSDPCGSFDIAEAQGRAMAGAVVKASEYAIKEPEVDIAVASRDLPLPCFDPPPVEEAEALLAQLKQEAAGRQNASYGWKKLDAGVIAWAERVAKLAREGATGLTVPFEIQAIRLGDFGLVALPGEVFVEYALNIDAGAGYAETATMGYANGNVGYVPTAEAYAQGGYEVDNAIRYYGDTMIAPEAEQLILEGALGLLAQLKGAGTAGAA